MNKLKAFAAGLLAATFATQGYTQQVTPGTTITPIPSVTPANDMVCTLGDSLTFINWGLDPSTATPLVQGVRGYAFWAQFLSNGRVRFPYEYNFGVSGENSTQILARVSSVIAAPCAAVVVLSGRNEYPSNGTVRIPTTSIITNLQSTASQLRAAGKIVYFMTILPSGTTTTAYYTTAQAQSLNAVNAYIRRQLSNDVPGTIVIDAWNDIADPANSLDVWAAGLMSSNDTTHYLAPGAYLIGKALAADINVRWPIREVLPRTNSDAYDATYNPTGCLNANPMVQGTSGVLFGTTPTPTGTVAQGWVLSGSDAGLTLAGSKVTSASTGRTMQQITVGGTSSATGSSIQFYQNLAGYANINPGDVVEATAYVESDSPTGLGGWALDMRTSDGTTQLDADAGYKAHDPGINMPSVAYSGIMRTPRMTITTGQPTSASIRLTDYTAYTSGTAISHTVRISNICVRKVIAGY